MQVPTDPRAAVVVVASGKGGTGQSTICAGLGAALAAAERQVLLLDLHPSAGLKRICRAQEQSIGPLGSDATAHAGLSLLHVPVSSAQLDEWAVRAAGAGFDVVLVDAPQTLGEGLVDVVGLANIVLLVTTPEPAALDGLYELLKSLQEGKDRPSVLRLILNDVRRPEEAALLPQAVDVMAERFGAEVRPMELIPHDPQLWIAARRTGGPLAAGPSSGLGPALAHIAAALEPLGQEG